MVGRCVERFAAERHTLRLLQCGSAPNFDPVAGPGSMDPSCAAPSDDSLHGGIVANLDAEAGAHTALWTCAAVKHFLACRARATGWCAAYASECCAGCR